jgi:lipid-A-disaccharide synthase-like uncharacterized protein
MDVLRHPMAIVGLLGQGMFFMRFLYQWIASERSGASVVPTAFWYFSICGALLVLTYAIWRKDPIFILGPSVGVIIYTRNLVLISRSRRAQPVP